MENEINIQPKSRIPLKWQPGSGIKKQKADLSLFDILFLLLVVTSLSEIFFLQGIVEQLQSGNMKPSWGLFTVLILAVEPYKEIVYVCTVVVSFVWLVLAIYRSWFKKK